MNHDASPKTSEEIGQPDFGKIILATIAGILILGGITYVGYRLSSHKVDLPKQRPVGGCEQCVSGTFKRFNDWDLNKNGAIDDCTEACRAYWGPQCTGKSYCSNQGSNNPSSCCTCVTENDEQCM